MLRIILIFGVFFSIEALMHDDHHQESLNRTKRYLLVFPPNSATGVLIALAIPLDLPHRAVFVSYNFETNFNPPQKTTDYTQGILQKFPSTQAPNGAFPTGDGERRNFDTGLITRKSMYKMVEDHVGRGCLLRTICDAANEPIGRHNGIVGDLIHVVFSPSTSQVEDLPEEIYEAEEQGKQKNCKKFEQKCPISLLDLITTKFNLFS